MDDYRVTDNHRYGMRICAFFTFFCLATALFRSIFITLAVSFVFFFVLYSREVQNANLRASRQQRRLNAIAVIERHSVVIARNAHNHDADLNDEGSEERNLRICKQLITKKVIHRPNEGSTYPCNEIEQQEKEFNDESTCQKCPDKLDLEETVAKTCTICLEPFQVGENVSWSRMNDCLHVHHFDCILPWYMRHDECPCCRRTVIKKDSNAVLEDSKNDDLIFCVEHGLLKSSKQFQEEP